MFLEIITNPVVLSVALMLILCGLRLNILIVMVIISIVAGLAGHMSIAEIMPTFLGGMGGNMETAFSYVLLGAIAVGIDRSGLAGMLSGWLKKVFRNKKNLFLIALAFIAALSQNLIPVNIAFIPILIPALLPMMNEMKLDRRAAALSLCWGLKASYMIVPLGFGLIFHNLISSNMSRNGLAFATSDVWKAMIIPVGIGMTLGLLFGIFVLYNKPREYKDIEVSQSDINPVVTKFGKPQLGALLGALSTLAIQLIFKSLVLGGVVGLLIMIAFGSFKYREFDDVLQDGVVTMGWIAFVMLAASGYSEVIIASHGVDLLVETAAIFLSGSKIVASAVMILIGLVIVMGTGTTFGTVPILAAIYVPICMNLGFSPLATACVIGVAAAIGDTSSPASDGTLGPTSGLNADGQHDHIRDSSIPAFIAFCAPVFVLGVVAAGIIL